MQANGCQCKRFHEFREGIMLINYQNQYIKSSNQLMLILTLIDKVNYELNGLNQLRIRNNQ